MSRATGKALLVITHTGNDYYHTTVHVQSNSATGPYAHDWVHQALHDMADLALPNGHDFEAGDRIWLSVVYEITGSTEYWGEYNEDVDFHKIRTLKRYIHPYNRPNRNMLLTTLLRKAYEFTQEFPGHEGVKTLVKAAKEGNRDLKTLILSWDVRCIGELRDRIPDAFPRKLRGVPLVGTQNIHGAWRVDPKETT
jgi:hypothetical protein